MHPQTAAWLKDLDFTDSEEVCAGYSTSQFSNTVKHSNDKLSAAGSGYRVPKVSP